MLCPRQGAVVWNPDGSWWRVMQRQSRVPELLGTLYPGVRKLKGKSFYLDAVKTRSSALLAEAIVSLGGKVESFLNKDVSFVVSGSREARMDCPLIKEPERVGSVQATTGSPVSTNCQDALGNNSSHTATPRPAVYGSRGKALLERAIRNHDICPGSSVLANARSWGVKIVHVDDFLVYVDQLIEESFMARKRELESTPGKPSSWIVKAGGLKSPYLKIEDSSRKYRPLHMQSASFPLLNYTGRFSPFEVLGPPPLAKEKDQETSKGSEEALEDLSNMHPKWEDCPDPGSSQVKLLSAPLRTPPARQTRRRTQGFCECCQLTYREEADHLESEQHRRFARDASRYSTVDGLISLMQPCFVEIVAHSPALIRSPPQALGGEACPELEDQVTGDTDRAFQALLSPVKSGSSPALSAPAEEMIVFPQFSSCTAALPVCQKKEEVTPPLKSPEVLLSVLPAAPGAAPLCSASDPEMAPMCVAACAEESGLQDRPQEASRLICTCEPSEWSCGCSGSPFNFPNPRKRSRSYSLSSETSKRPRTTLQPVCCTTWHCVSDPVQQDGGSDLRHSHYTWECLPDTGSAPKTRFSGPALSINPELILSVHNSAQNPQVNVAPAEQSSACGHCGGPSEGVSSHACPDLVLTVIPSASVEPGAEQSCGRRPRETSKPHKVLSSSDTSLSHNPPQSYVDALDVTQDAVLGRAVLPHTFLVPDFSLSLQPLVPSCEAVLHEQSMGSPVPLSHSLSSLCIDSSLLPDPSACFQSSSDSDWDRVLLSQSPRPRVGGGCALGLELLQRPCVGIRDEGYESRLCSVLHPPTPPPSVCDEDAHSPSSYCQVDAAWKPTEINEVSVNWKNRACNKTS